MSEENLYLELTKGRFHLMVPLPKADGTSFDVPMVVLSGREEMTCKTAADLDTRRSFGKEQPTKDQSSKYDSVYSDHLAYHTIYHAVRLPSDTSKKLFPSKDAVMESLTPEQAGILTNHYMMVKINQPYMMNLDHDDPEKVETLIQKIIEAGKEPAFFLNSMSYHATNVLISCLGSEVGKLRKLLKESGSSGLPSNDTPATELTQNELPNE